MDIHEVINKAVKLRDIGGNPKKALSFVLRYEPSGEVYKDLIDFLILKAVLFRDTGDLKSSVETYKEALKIIRPDDYVNKADILRSMAFISIYTDGTDIAYKYAEEALDVLRNKRGKKYYRVRANIYAAIGNILYENKQYNEALENYKKGLYWAREDSFHQREITLGGDIANICIAQKEYTKAIKIISRNLSLAKKSYRISVPQLYLRRSRIYFDLEKFDMAVQDIKEAIDVCKKEGWFRDLGEAYEAMGDVLKEMKDDNFRKYYKKAQRIYTKGKYSLLLNRMRNKKILILIYLPIYTIYQFLLK